MSGKSPAEAAGNAAQQQQNTAAQAVDVDAIRREAASHAIPAATAAERARISAIIGCEEAKGREALAHELAFETDLSVDAAKKLLAKGNKQEVAEVKQPNKLEAAMGDIKNPKVGADVAGGTSEDEAAKVAGNILTLYRGPEKRSA